jgi:hypothetical protein
LLSFERSLLSFHCGLLLFQNVTEKQALRFAKFRERKSRIKKDVVRTDGLLPFYR